jgi:trans-aconitate 2-methyltransferase
VEEPVDAVLSTATFHWIRDHQALFANLAAVMRPDAQLAAQCGGAGNIANVEAALRELGENFGGRKHFAGVRGTRADLKAAGFTDIEVWLHEEPTELAPEDLEPYLATICLGDHVEGMTDTKRKAFVHEVAQRMPTSQIDYVRLNIRARRSVEET